MEETLEDLKREYMKEIYIANIKIQALTKENEELREASKTLLSLCDLEDNSGRLVHKEADKEILRKLLTPKN